MAKQKSAGDPSASESGAVSLESLTSQIRAADQSAARGAWQVGKLLLAARELVERGEWESYLRESFGWSRQYAARLMYLAESYPEELPVGASLWLLYQAAGLEVQIQDRVLDLIESAKMSRAESEAVVRSAKDRGRSADAKLAELNSPDYLDKLRAQVAADYEAKAAPADKVELADLTRENAAIAAENKKLKAEHAKLEKQAKLAGEKQTALEQVNGKLAEANEQIAELKRQTLTPREVRVEVPVVPVDYDNLKADLSALRDEKTAISQLADERLVKIRELEAAAGGAGDSAELLQVRGDLERLRRQYEERVLKFENILAERRRLKSRVVYLESVLTSAGVEFKPEEVPLSE